EEEAATLTNYPLNVVVVPGAATLTLLALYDAARFPGAAAARLLALLAGERQLLLHEWNDTASAYPRHAGIADLFAAMASAAPAAPAVIEEPAAAADPAGGAVW